MSLESIIHNLDLKNVKTTAGTTFGQEMVSAANLLRNCIQSRINRGTMGNVLTTADIADVQVVFWLLNDGFEVKKKWAFSGFKHPERWTIRIAEHFVEEGIADFNLQNRLGIKVEVKRPLLYYG